MGFLDVYLFYISENNLGIVCELFNTAKNSVFCVAGDQTGSEGRTGNPSLGSLLPQGVHQSGKSAKQGKAMHFMVWGNQGTPMN